MSLTSTIRGMAKKKAMPGKGDKKPADEKVVIYLEVPALIKERMDDLAAEHDRRLTGECIQAFKEYLARHKLWPPSGDSSDN